MNRHSVSLLSSALVAPLVVAPAFAQQPRSGQEQVPPLPSVATHSPEAALPHPVAAPPPPSAAPGSPPWVKTEMSTLYLLRQKGVVSQAEYDSALHDLAETSGARASDNTTFVVGKFAATLYGFTELDAIWDSTQSFNDIAGNAQVARPTTYAGSHSRMQFGIRNSRFGIRVKAPETPWVRVSGVLELDFEGTTLPIGSGQPYFSTEAVYFNGPTFRLRHGYMKVETPVVDAILGETWTLFGWGTMAFPNNVGIMGLPGQIFSRTAQIRLSHTFKSDVADVEVAVAAVRPPQRNAGVPVGQAGLRVAFPKWTGMQTVNSTGTQIAPLAVGVSGDVRRVEVNEWSPDPKNSVGATGYGMAIDLFAPIIPATKDRKGNSLSLTGEVAYTKGVTDLYTGLTGGVPIAPALPIPTGASPAPAYTPDIDPGLASYTVDGSGKATLNLMQWTTFNVGLQYYFPGLDGRLFMSANYARTMSSNTKDTLGVVDPTNSANAEAVTKAKSRIRDHEDWFDVNLLGDPCPGVRLGLEYAHFADTYLDGTQAINHRVQFSGFYLF